MRAAKIIASVLEGETTFSIISQIKFSIRHGSPKKMAMIIGQPMNSPTVFPPKKKASDTNCATNADSVANKTIRICFPDDCLNQAAS